MTKKSSKRTLKISANLILNCLAFVLAVVSIFMIFAPALNVKGTLINDTYSGVHTTFGFIDGDYVYLSFSFLNLLPYLLIIFALVLLVLKMANVIKAKYIDYIIIALLVVAGVLFFLNTVMTNFSQSYANTINNFSLKKSMLTGPIVAGVLTLVSALTLLLKLELS